MSPTYQNSFFIYDRSNIIKITFISELNKILPIISFFSYFGTTETTKLHLPSSKNAQSFSIEKDAIKNTIDFQIALASGLDLVTNDKKVHELFITKLNKKEKSIRVLEFIMIREQQGFGDGREISPIEIKIESNKIQNIFDKFKNSKIRFKLNGILFTSSVKNDTEKIFLQTTGLTGAKYALINDKYKQVIGVIKLNEIENWSEIKNSSRWENFTFQEQKDHRNTSHPSFNFTTNNKDDVLGFHLKLIDTNNNLITFADGVKKIPIIEFIIEFLG